MMGKKVDCKERELWSKELPFLPSYIGQHFFSQYEHANTELGTMAARRKAEMQNWAQMLMSNSRSSNRSSTLVSLTAG